MTNDTVGKWHNEQVLPLCKQLGKPSTYSHTELQPTEKHSAQVLCSLRPQDHLQEAESVCLCVNLEVTPMRRYSLSSSNSYIF